MNKCMLTLVLVSLFGCTTLRTIPPGQFDAAHPAESGELLKVGDRVVLHTTDGQTHPMQVKAIHDGVIEGDGAVVRIDDVAFAQKRELSVGKTVLFAGVVIGVVALGYLISWFATYGGGLVGVTGG
jgi:hypothetical protein